MTSTLKKKILRKNISSKKINFRDFQEKIFSPSGVKTRAHLVANLPRAAILSGRKVRNKQVLKNGGFLYNASFRNAYKAESAGNHMKTVVWPAVLGSSNKSPRVLLKRRNWPLILNKAEAKWEVAEKRPTVIVKAKTYPHEDTPLLIILQNKLIYDGRKGAAEKVFFRTMQELNRHNKNGSGYALFYTALEHLKPVLITVVRRVGRNYYNVPVPLKGMRQYKVAFQ
jgi:hypothetical protein